MFQDDLQTPEQKEEFHRWYGQMADAVDASLKSYPWVLEHVNERFKATGKDTHLVASLLLIEFADPIDGVAILTRKGSARNCVPVIRSGFELQLNLMYMLQREDTLEDRCLAYEFFHWVKQQKVAVKCDPNSDVGKQVRSQTKGELLADAFDHPERDINAEIAALQKIRTCPLVDVHDDTVTVRPDKPVLFLRLRACDHREGKIAQILFSCCQLATKAGGGMISTL